MFQVKFFKNCKVRGVHLYSNKIVNSHQLSFVESLSNFSNIVRRTFCYLICEYKILIRGIRRSCQYQSDPLKMAIVLKNTHREKFLGRCKIYSAILMTSLRYYCIEFSALSHILLLS